MKKFLALFTFFSIFISFFDNESVWAQNCGEVTTVVDNDGRIVSDIATDSAGNVYISQSLWGSSVFRLTQSGERSTFIDGVDGPGGLTVDENGNLYLIEYNTQKIKLYNPDGDLLDEMDTGMDGATGLALDSKNNLYIANFGKIDETDDQYTSSGDSFGIINLDDETRTVISDVELNSPVDVEVDEYDNVYIANGNDGKIFKYSERDGLTLLAEAEGDVRFGWLAYSNGAVFTTHFSGHTIYKTDVASGEITPLAGTGEPGSDDGDLNTATFHRPNGISPTYNGNGLYITETNYEADISRLRLLTLCE